MTEQEKELLKEEMYNKKVNNIIPNYNDLTSYFRHYISSIFNTEVLAPESIILELKEEDIYGAAVPLLSLISVMINEDIIENKGNMIYESKLYNKTLDYFCSLISEEQTDNTFKIGNTIGTSADIFTIIRHKLGHGDFYYDSTTSEIVLNKEEGAIRIPVSLLMNLFINLYTESYSSYKSTEFTRNILLNKSKNRFNRVIENVNDAEEFLSLLTIQRYKIERYDKKELTKQEKIEINKEVVKLQIDMFNGEDIKNKQQELIKEYQEKGILLTITNEKVKHHKEKQKLIDALMKNEDGKHFEDMDLLTYYYGEIVSKIIDDKYDKKGIIYGILTNLITLEKLKLYKITNLHNLSDVLPENVFLDISENLVSIFLARFQALYCYPLDEIYKKDRNYHLDREDLLDFSKLDLSELHPDIMEPVIQNNPIEEQKNKLLSIGKRINSLLNKTEKDKKNLAGILSKPIQTPKMISYRQKIQQELKTINQKLSLLSESYVINQDLYNVIEKDYNSNYFRNLNIIEGMRNSIAHGNVRIINISNGQSNDEILLQFTNYHKDKICFQMTTSLYQLESLFLPKNTVVLDEFVANKKKNVKESLEQKIKVLK